MSINANNVGQSNRINAALASSKAAFTVSKKYQAQRNHSKAEFFKRKAYELQQKERRS